MSLDDLRPDVQLSGHVRLEWVRAGGQRAIPEGLITNSKLTAEWWAEEVGRKLVVALEAEVLAERLCSDSYQVTFLEPATWWDHWKLAHPPRRHRSRVLYHLASPYHRWWRRHQPRWVQRSLTVALTRRKLYPHSGIPHDPRLGSGFLVDQVTHSWKGTPYGHLRVMP